MKAIAGLLGWVALLLGASGHAATISERDYRDKVYASWLGQMIGNFYGLSYEFKFIDQPGPDQFPYGYGDMLDRIAQVDGAFSDDDTDIEYMYLLQMEKHGPEPSYRALTQAWTHHVRERVWAANRQALALMHAGYTPPLTGARQLNSEWFQIDPQLVNEIWAVTAPGMINYATAKTDWAARITNDSFGVEPAIHYAAMYAAAFFERDINTLIDIGTAALGEQSHFAAVVRHMQRLHRQYPKDWQRARAEMARTYAKKFPYNPDSWVAIDATLNGAAGILALLYGQGDFQRTLDLACALGFDADNQAATMSGLLGIIGGLSAIPEHLLYPFGRERWAQPFNDRYINVSRFDLPDASLRDMARRIADQGIALIEMHGGKRLPAAGGAMLTINSQARFVAPLALPAVPSIMAQQNQPFAFDFDPANQHPGAAFRVAEGALPKGVQLTGAQLRGTAATPGRYTFSIEASRATNTVSQRYQLEVLGRNLALDAEAVLARAPVGADPEVSLEVLRDGRQGLDAEGLKAGPTFYTPPSEGLPAVEYFGYRWAAPQSVVRLRYNIGYVQESSGWPTSLEVQYLDADNRWRQVSQLQISPAMPLDNNKYNKGKYMVYTLAFDAVVTQALRMVVTAGGVDQDDPRRPREYAVAINELAVYGE